MRELPKGGIVGKAAELISRIVQMRIPVYAAHACYFIVLSLFPTLVLLMSLVRYTGLDVDALIQILDGVIPTVLMPTATKLIMNTYYGTTSTVISISALAALWSASRGIQGLRAGLNVIYGATENRGYFRTRAVSVFYTLLFLLVLLLTLVLHIFGRSLLAMQHIWDNRFIRFLSEVVDLRFFVLLAVQTLLFTAVFMALPNQKNTFVDSLPGALLASIGWLIFTDLYSTYVTYFRGYANIYGSVYVLALSMLWLYCCISIVFYGGVLNCLLCEKEKPL